MVLGHGLVADAGVLVRLLGLREVLLRDDAAFYEYLHTLVFLLRHLVGYTGFLHGVALGDVARRKQDERHAFAHAHALGYFPLERHDACHGGYGYPLVALRGQYLPAGLDDLGEVARFYGTCLYACGLCLGGRHDDFVRGTFGMGGFGV